MRWSNITAAQDEASFFEDYVKLVLSAPSIREFPPRIQNIGKVKAQWSMPIGTREFTIITTGGTSDDRALAESIVRNQLKSLGPFKQATVDFDVLDRDGFESKGLTKEATWDDVMAKAKRLIQSGAVQLLRNGYNNIVSRVQGDTGNHEVEISREDPQSRAITQWNCDCGWAEHAFQRTRQWKKYEARPCSHTLATYWSSLSAPLDEDIHPNGQGQLFNTPMSPPMPTPGPAQGPAMPSYPQQQLPGMEQQPQGPDILPQFPMEGGPPAVNPVSVPGLKQPSPMNPVQYPGGTFSKVANDWDFGADDDVNEGHKFVYSTRDGRGLIAGPKTYHPDLASQAGIPAEGYYGGTIDPSGLVWVYSWPNKAGLGVSDTETLDQDRHPPRMLQWIQKTIPHAYYPQNRTDLLKGNEYGDRIAAAHVPQGPGFESGYMVQLKEEDIGTAVGKSQEHGAGQFQTIPANSIGEVMGQDPTTGWVDVLFTGPCAGNGPMEPFGVQGWFEPDKLVPRPDIARPGPAIRRR